MDALTIETGLICNSIQSLKIKLKFWPIVVPNNVDTSIETMKPRFIPDHTPWRQFIYALVSFALLLRFCIGLHPYSGKNTPPMFGDYEAQRHWMEITINLSPTQWYKNSSKNNLSYWGLDYPPLSGYQSWVCGKFLEYFDPSSVALESSKGHESPLSKFLMRTTVLVSDTICYIPACFAASLVFYRNQREKQLVSLIALLTNPSLLIIDHGHFQYNSISLGCAMLGAALISNNNIWIGSILFCASLNHKQMSLYMAPAFFAFLFGICLQQKTFFRKIILLLSIGTVVAASFLIFWAPFSTSMHDVFAVINRIFPTQRGLFEDYVANFWCVSSLVIKWKKLIALPQQMLSICTLTTLFAFLPSVILTIARPTQRAFLLCLANAAFSFFLFSYQVHEKSILLPLLPSTLLFAEQQAMAQPLLIASMLSMYPLLKKDGLSVGYGALILITIGIWQLIAPLADNKIRKKKKGVDVGTNASRTTANTKKTTGVFLPWNLAESICQQSIAISLASLLLIHGIAVTFHAPQKYPYIFDALMVTWSFLHFTSAFFVFYREQWLEFKQLY